MRMTVRRTVIIILLAAMRRNVMDGRLADDCRIARPGRRLDNQARGWRLPWEVGGIAFTAPIRRAIHRSSENATRASIRLRASSGYGKLGPHPCLIVVRLVADEQIVARRQSNGQRA